MRPAGEKTVPSWQAAEWFRPTADHLPVLIWIADTNKLCTWFNKTWLDFVGRTMEQELGNGWADNVHPDDFDRCLKTYVTSFDARVPFRMEYRLKRFDGVYEWILDEGLPLYAADGDFAGYIGCCLLISEQKTTETKLQDLNFSLMRANEDLALSLQRERRIAQTLQSAFLPPYLPDVDGVALQAVYRPAEREAQVGGDWYDVYPLRDGRIALSIGDVFGHGLDAAGAMIRLRETLRALTGLVDQDPAEILHAADRAFQASHPGSIATAIFGIFDPVSRQFIMANAGHPRPVLVRQSHAHFIESEGVPLGVTEDSAFEIFACRLEHEDSLVLYTDGLIESERDIVAGEQRLLRSLSGAPIEAESLVSALTADLRQDDIAVLVLSVTAPAARSLWQFKSDDARSAQHARIAFEAHLREIELNADAINAAALVFGELVANVVRHAPGPIEVESYLENNSLVLLVRDRGPIFVAGDFTLPSDVMSEGGRGLFLVAKHAYLQSISKRPGGGNEVCVRMPLD